MDKSDTFLLERYKYVLAQKQALNKTTLTIVTVYQAGVGLIAAGQFRILSGYEEAKLSAETAVTGSLSLLGLLAILSVFAICLLSGGLAAWAGYRRDEAEVELVVFGQARPLPRLKDALAWYETYVIAVIVVLFVLTCVFMFLAVFPRIS